jgi:hypothetical protein
MEEPESPPTPNILRPHHISLLMVIMLLYRHYPRKRFHPSFLIQVHRVLLEEIVEVSLPMYRYTQLDCRFRLHRQGRFQNCLRPSRVLLTVTRARSLSLSHLNQKCVLSPDAILHLLNDRY